MFGALLLYVTKIILSITSSSYFIDTISDSLYLIIIQEILTLKVDPRMKAVLKKMAEKQFFSTSAAIKQAVEKYLQNQGVEGRKEKIKKQPKE